MTEPMDPSVLYETVIGLEIHVQLDTRTKLFCRCRNVYGAAPNTHICPVCLGAPGALPVLNGKAVELAVRAALALGCTVHERSVFARKNYAYPDLPKGYQITQFARPLATDGRVRLEAGDATIRIRRVHLEEDAGKSIHDRFPGRTAIDLNRAGVPLIEIVTEPDLSDPEQARALLLELKRTLEYLGVSDCDMEKGSLRVDANLSVRPAGAGNLGNDPDADPTAADTLGVKTEVKNLNSFRAVERALAFEADRQIQLLEAGDRVAPETRLWDPDAHATRAMRGKEAVHDYRYFPEPDLPPLMLDAGRVRTIGGDLPEPPSQREARFAAEYRLPATDAGILTADRATADYFEALAAAAADPKAAANWVMGAVMEWMNQTGEGIDALPVEPERLAGLIGLAGEGRVSSTAAQEVFTRMAAGDERSASDIVDAEGLAQVGDTDRLEVWVRDALAEHPAEAERLEAGEAKLIGFFVGAVMRASGGAADPEKVRALLSGRVEG